MLAVGTHQPPRLTVGPVRAAERARLVFGVAPGSAVNATVIDMVSRFRMIASEVDVVRPDAPLPRLPVARAFWVPRPDLETGAAA